MRAQRKDEGSKGVIISPTMNPIIFPFFFVETTQMLNIVWIRVGIKKGECVGRYLHWW
jgi:hypothetical protein